MRNDIIYSDIQIQLLLTSQYYNIRFNFNIYTVLKLEFIYLNLE